MDEGPEIRRRRRVVFIVSGLIDMFLGGMLVLLGLELLPAGLVGFHLPPLGMLFGVIMLITGTAVVIYNLTRLGE